MLQKLLPNLVSQLVFPILIFSSGVVRADQQACEGGYYLRDLQVEHLKIAYQDVGQLLSVLSTLGYETVTMEGQQVAPAARSAGQSSYSPPGSYSPQYTPGSTGTSQPTGQPGMGYQRSYQGASQTSPYSPSSSSVTTPKPEVDAKKYDCNKLPVVVKPPAVADDRLGFDAGDFLGLGGGGSSGGSSSYGGGSSYGGSSSGKVSGDISPALHSMSKPHSGEVDHLLVFYHKSQADELRRLESLVRHKLDVPASQIYIEGLVLEVSEEGLDELGVQYQRVDPEAGRNISIGAIGASPVAAGGQVLLILFEIVWLGTSGLANRSLLQLQALISKGEAEVLSRPSVLTLSNRQATIQIIDIVQFPIQEATITSSGDIVQSAFKFEAVRPGITLNLRPRVSSDLQSVSMEIDVTVEALVSANNGEVRSNQGQVIATKPGSSTRRVQTFARIPDRTPIIVGGLISTDKETVRNRVPVLGRIPVIGKIFGATKNAVGKREVIIVLTPYIVGEQTSLANVSVPKDTSLFDTDDASLFQDSYRVRAEDIYDLKFLRDSPAFDRYQTMAEKVRDEDPRLAAEEPYRHFLSGNVPGGDRFLNRMVFDLVRRREFGAELTHEQLIVIEKNTSGDAQVALVQNLASRLHSSGGRALYLVFDTSEEDGETASIEFSAIPSGESWSEQLWDLSYDDTGRSAIILRHQTDLEMLVDAMKTSAIIDRNGGYDSLTVGRFSTGTLFSIPSFDTDRFYVIDEKVARVFADIQHYYRASSRDVEKVYREMDDLNPVR